MSVYRIGRSVETTFNHALKEALCKTTARWRQSSEVFRVENTQVLAGTENTRKRPDILILENHLQPVIIECSYGEQDANSDAIARLNKKTQQGHLEIKTTIAVHIPTRFQELDLTSSIADLGKGGTIRYALHQINEYRWPASGFVSGNVNHLALLLSAASLPKEDVEAVADKVADLVNQSADILELALSDNQKESISNLVYQRSVLKGLRTTMVLWLNALLTQQRLSTQSDQKIPPLNFSRNSVPSPAKQAKIWRAILEANWRSIFEPAVYVLEESGNTDPSATANALKLLTHAVEIIELARLGLHINVGAELFPKLSDDRKQAAAFYTQPATAELLAALVVRIKDLENDTWRSSELFNHHSLADLTCGTGTLLRAGYRRICAIHESFGGTTDSVRKLHRSAMEAGLIGTDVSPIAAHLTTSSLAAIGLGEPYGDTKIGWLEVGRGGATTGSLEYFENPAVDNYMERVTGISAGTENESSQIIVNNESLKWILMNPPYSRTRGGQSAFDIAGLSEEERINCQKRWRWLVRKEPVNNKAGMAASFLALASKKIKPGGRIGFVLPLTAAFADSWKITRRMIEHEFKDIIAITVASGKALGRDALSADTGMEEMLLIATKRTFRQVVIGSSPIHCVILRDPPNQSGEAGEIARVINTTVEKIEEHTSSCPLIAGNSELGSIVVLDTTGYGNPWSPLGIIHSDLALAAQGLVNGKLDYLGRDSISIDIGMTTVDKLFDVGPTHDLIGYPLGGSARGAFEMYPVTSSEDAIGQDRALWQANSKKQNRLVVLPTHKGIPSVKTASESDRAKMRQKRSNLLYARNMRWTSQSLLAVTTNTPVMGGRAWTTLAYADDRICKAFVLWANSTLGMVVHWTQGQRTQLGRSTTQIGALKKIPCPKLNKLDNSNLNEAARSFNKLQNKKLRPTCQAHADQIRIKIDEAVIQMLKIPTDELDTIATLRQLWCSEPSIHGHNKQALNLLEKVKIAYR